LSFADTPLRHYADDAAEDAYGCCRHAAATLMLLPPAADGHSYAAADGSSAADGRYAALMIFR